MSDEAVNTEGDDIVGEIHILFRGDGQADINTSFDVAQFNFALDTIKLGLVTGDLKLQDV